LASAPETGRALSGNETAPSSASAPRHSSDPGPAPATGPPDQVQHAGTRPAAAERVTVAPVADAPSAGPAAAHGRAGEAAGGGDAAADPGSGPAHAPEPPSREEPSEEAQPVLDPALEAAAAVELPPASGRDAAGGGGGGGGGGGIGGLGANLVSTVRSFLPFVARAEPAEGAPAAGKKPVKVRRGAFRFHICCIGARLAAMTCMCS